MFNIYIYIYLLLCMGVCCDPHWLKDDRLAAERDAVQCVPAKVAADVDHQRVWLLAALPGRLMPCEGDRRLDDRLEHKSSGRAVSGSCGITVTEHEGACPRRVNAYTSVRSGILSGRISLSAPGPSSWPCPCPPPCKQMRRAAACASWSTL